MLSVCIKPCFLSSFVKADCLGKSKYLDCHTKLFLRSQNCWYPLWKWFIISQVYYVFSTFNSELGVYGVCIEALPVDIWLLSRFFSAKLIRSVNLDGKKPANITVLLLLYRFCGFELWEKALCLCFKQRSCSNYTC